MNATRHTATAPCLRIAVLGVGGIGSAFAFQLAAGGGHEVTVIARPGSARLKQLQRDGGLAKANGEHARVTVADTLDSPVPYDLVIVTVQAHRLADVLPALEASNASSILFVVNQFHPEQVEDVLGPARCVFGMPFIQASIDGDGKLDARIGKAGPKTVLGRQDLVTLFTQAGIPAAFEPRMALWLRCHVPLCIGFESVSAAAVKRGTGASWNEATTIATGVQESLALIKRLGFPLYPRGKVLLDRMPRQGVAAILWSMSRITSFRTLLATGAPEARALTSVLVAAASGVMPEAAVRRIEAMAPSE